MANLSNKKYLTIDDLSGITGETALEFSKNKTTVLNSGSTHTQYPSAKIVYDTIIDNEEVVAAAINELNTNKASLNHTHASSSITDFNSAVKAIKVNSASTADSADTATNIEKAYFGIHPEVGGDINILPFFTNDLAFLLNKGGAAVNYFINNSVTDYTPNQLTSIGTGPISDFFNCFDGSSEYSYFNALTSTTQKVVIDLTLHKKFYWSNTFYIDFGNLVWGAKTISVLTGTDNGTYTLNGSITNVSRDFYRCYIVDSEGNGFNKIRIVLTDFYNTKPRIAEIGLIEYNSKLGRETFMSRGNSTDDIYRNLSPSVSETYNLGESSKKWGTVYSVNTNTTILNTFNINASGYIKLTDWEPKSLLLGAYYNTNGTENHSAAAISTDNAHDLYINHANGKSVIMNSMGGGTVIGGWQLPTGYKLFVAGNTKISSNIDVEGNATIAGNITTNKITLSNNGNSVTIELDTSGNLKINGNLVVTGIIEELGN